MGPLKIFYISVFILWIIIPLALTFINKPNRQLRSDSIRLFFSYLFATGLAIVVIIPIVLTVYAPFAPSIVSSSSVLSNASDVRPGISFSSFEILWKSDFFKWLGVTTVVSIITTVLLVIVVACVGYSYSRYRFKGKKGSLIFAMIIQMIPTLAAMVTYITMRHSIGYFIAPTGIFSVFTIFGLSLDQAMGFTTLILIYLSGGVGMNLFLMKGNYDQISRELDEAARIDGAGPFRVFTQIVIPLVRPMLSVVAVFTFIGPFFDVILARLILPTETYTIANYLYRWVENPNSQELYNVPAFMAGSIIIAIPIVFFFMIMQNNLVSGLSSGGTKG